MFNVWFNVTGRVSIIVYINLFLSFYGPLSGCITFLQIHTLCRMLTKKVIICVIFTSLFLLFLFIIFD